MVVFAEGMEEAHRGDRAAITSRVLFRSGSVLYSASSAALVGDEYSGQKNRN